jgi:hypothetical protein
LFIHLHGLFDFSKKIIVRISDETYYLLQK